MSATYGRRRVLIPVLILLAALVPLTFSVLLYLQPGWFALGHTNHGRLIRPPVKIVGTARLPADFFRKHWTLVYIGGTHCGADCKEALYATRQIRLGLAGYPPGVRRLYIVRGRTDAGAYLRSAQPDLTVVEATDAAGERFVGEFTRVSGATDIYVVDPAGLLMMTYPANRDPTGLLEDMRQLLGVTQE
ncbi:MAG: hypothetical protein ACRES7_02845 [Gammaproteobacteria bacterium]